MAGGRRVRGGHFKESTDKNFMPPLPFAILELDGSMEASIFLRALHEI